MCLKVINEDGVAKGKKNQKQKTHRLHELDNGPAQGSSPLLPLKSHIFLYLI